MALYGRKTPREKDFLNLAELQSSFATKVNGIAKRSLLTKL
jgi:hypothetical protein